MINVWGSIEVDYRSDVECSLTFRYPFSSGYIFSVRLRPACTHTHTHTHIHTMGCHNTTHSY